MAFAFQMDHLKCPDISITAKYISPVTQAMKLTCGYFRRGHLIKHGEEIEFDKKGSISRIKFYNHDIEGPDPEQEKESFETIEDLIRVLAFEKVSDNKKLKLVHCDKEIKTWVHAALTRNTVKKSYAWNEGCDFQGSFLASFLEEFPVKLKLKNLSDFTKARMIVKMRINQGPSGIRYEFDVREGAMTGTSGIINFKVHYEVDVDPLTGSTKYSTQDGKITLTRVGDRVLNLSRPLLFLVP
jgi:hypothetical protein